MSDAQDTPVNPPAQRVPVRILFWLALVAGYVLASVTGHRSLAIAIVGLMAGALCWVSGRRLAALLVSLGLAGASFYGAGSILFLVYVPPLAAFSFMAWFFSRTLRPGVEPLITRVARKEHPDLPAALVRYTRMLTRLWSGCFLTLLALALVLAPILPLASWSRWVHGLGYLLPGALLLGEYVYRLRRFRDLPHGSILVLITHIASVIREAATGSADKQCAPERDPG